jgi:hypothetical protein
VIDIGTSSTPASNFRPGVLQGQTPYDSYLQQHPDQIRSQSRQPSLENVPQPTSAYPTAIDQMSQAQSKSTKTSHGWGTLSEETIPKIVELRRLLNRHPTTFPNPEIIIQGAKHFCMMGDNSFLEEKLAYLRSVDTITLPRANQHNLNLNGK